MAGKRVNFTKQFSIRILEDGSLIITSHAAMYDTQVPQNMRLTPIEPWE